MAYIEIVEDKDPFALREKVNVILTQGDYAPPQYQIYKGIHYCMLFAAGRQVSPRASPEEHLTSEQIALSDRENALCLIKIDGREAAKRELGLNEDGLVKLLESKSTPKPE